MIVIFKTSNEDFILNMHKLQMWPSCKINFGLMYLSHFFFFPILISA